MKMAFITNYVSDIDTFVDDTSAHCNMVVTSVTIHVTSMSSFMTQNNRVYSIQVTDISIIHSILWFSSSDIILWTSNKFIYLFNSDAFYSTQSFPLLIYQGYITTHSWVHISQTNVVPVIWRWYPLRFIKGLDMCEYYNSYAAQMVKYVVLF